MNQKWGDLAPRFFSAVVMAAIGATALWAGGLWFSALGVAIIGVMIWELVRMIAPGHPIMAWQLGAVGAATLAGSLFVSGGVAAILLGLFLVVAVGRVGAHPVLVGAYCAGIWLAGYGFIMMRVEAGLLWTFWLIIVVVVTDIAGYFAGRIIGGPKFWPRVSPKKTWSGTIAGWIGAAAISAAMAAQFDMPCAVILGGVVLALASQMGDVAESAIKRRMNVKDSSNLIPGHGGFMDRFDGMMGAALIVTVWALLQAVI